MQPPFQHDLFKVSIAECVSHIPSHAQKNDFDLKTALFESVLHCHRCSSFVLFDVHPNSSALSSQYSHFMHNLKRSYMYDVFFHQNLTDRPDGISSSYELLALVFVKFKNGAGIHCMEFGL